MTTYSLIAKLLSIQKEYGFFSATGIGGGHACFNGQSFYNRVKWAGLPDIMPKYNPAMLKQVTVSLPFGIGSASWEVDSTERDAAWELYVELVTRVAVQSLHPQEGLVREAMNSLYSLFGSTREILRKAGPGVGASCDSVGGIAIAVLNR